MQDYRAIWVCTNCIMHHANGECGDCHEEEHQGGEPLSKLDHTGIAMGHPQSEHECSRDEDGIEYGYCDCVYTIYSASTCDGCGSFYHGERHAMTEWI